MKNRPGAPQVPYAIGGKVHMVTPPRPKLPRSLDRVLLGAITVACMLLLVAVIVWATVNIGELLSEMVPGWAAYGAASAFNLAWVICLGLEWIDRHNPDQANAPMVAGWVFLAAEMIAVGVHGHREGALEIGIVGAAVSAIVKTVWTLLLKRYATPLDPMTQQWVDAERAQLAAERGLLDVQRDALYARGQLGQYRDALGLDARQRTAPQLDAAPAADPAAPTVAPAATLVPAGQSFGVTAAATVDDPVLLARIIDAALADEGVRTKSDMVRAVVTAAPRLTAQEIADEIAKRRGVEVKASYVRTIRTGRPKSPTAQPIGAEPTGPARGHKAGPYL
ncbi:hypothetical protein [Streptomyces sp. NBC_01373]|uniref:hypothetical protein n=1 Tax=Streptomyces sp. NBC_01373 TaxID=2903843 RepID=UPI002251A30F|nr:hypothetical protein [Streptomyces sp. NBC_01373]MCX4705668.1 hypothetical protein [Streptomyces sp. NBC_01373]